MNRRGLLKMIGLAPAAAALATTKAFADGGYLSPRQLPMIGEGAEAFIPLKGGAIAVAIEDWYCCGRISTFDAANVIWFDDKAP